jgi:hypothetical protein
MDNQTTGREPRAMQCTTAACLPCSFTARDLLYYGSRTPCETVNVAVPQKSSIRPGRMATAEQYRCMLPRLRARLIRFLVSSLLARRRRVTTRSMENGACWVGVELAVSIGFVVDIWLSPRYESCQSRRKQSIGHACHTHTPSSRRLFPSPAIDSQTSGVPGA